MRRILRLFVPKLDIRLVIIIRLTIIEVSSPRRAFIV